MEKLRGAGAAVVGAGIVSLLHFGMGANNLGLSLLGVFVEAGFLSVIVWRDWAAAELQARAAILGCFALLFGLLIVAVTLPLIVEPGTQHLLPSVMPAADRQAAFIEILKLLGLACLFVSGLLIGSSLRRYRIMTIWMVCLAGGLAIFANVVDTIWPDRTMGLQRIAAHGRLTATFVSANTAATLFGGMALLVGAFLARRGRDGGRSSRSVLDRKPIAFAFMMLFTLSLLMTASRMGLVSTLLASTAIFAFRGNGLSGGWRGPAPLLACGALLALVGLLYGGGLARRLPELSSDIGYRLRLMQIHFAFFAERPWFGWGLGSFRSLNNQAITGENFSLLYDVGAVHNVYIQWLSQAGLVGAGLMGGTILLAVVLIGIGATREGEAGDHLAAIVAIVLLFMLHGASDYALEVPSMSALLTLLLGAGVGLATRKAPPRARKAPTPTASVGIG